MHQKLQKILSKYSTIILVGGGTGGHVQPIISVIEGFNTQTLKHSNTPQFLWIGGNNSQEEQAAKENHVEFMMIPTFKISTTRSPKILLYPFILLRGILEARKILKKVSVDNGHNGGSGGETVGAEKTIGKGRAEPGEASFSTTDAFGAFGNKSTVNTVSEIGVFSKGGPGSVAVGIAAWSLSIPLYIHESDTIPGRSNRILGKIATRIFLGFDSARKYFDSGKCEVIGQVLGASFAKEVPKGRRISSEKQRKIPPIPLSQGGPEWKTSKKHILVICGSQGSRAIFNTIAHDCQPLDGEWIISLGVLNRGINKDFATFADIQLLDWISQEDLAHLILDTDIAITRGSATTLAELTSFNNSKLRIHNLQLIIVPLPYAADNHQYWNAREYEKLGHILLEQKYLDQLPEIIKKLGQNSQPSST